MLYLNPYKDIKLKWQNLINDAHRYEDLLNINTQMFDHKFNTTEDIEINRFMIDSIEFKLNIFGYVAFFIYNKKLLCEPCFFIGPHNDYALPSDIKVVIRNQYGKTLTFKDWINNDKVIVMKNNKLASTDNNRERLANLLVEVDKSYKCNIENSRLSPILKYTSPVNKKEVEKVLDNIKDGKPQSLQLQVNEEDDEQSLEVVNITNVDDSSKIQFLDLAKESLWKRYFQENGINMNSSVKKAQQSISEIQDGSNSAYIYPTNKLQARCDCIDEFREKFNISYSCEFSTCWKQGYEYIQQPLQEINDKGGEENGTDGKGPNNEPDSNSQNKQPDDNNNE